MVTTGGSAIVASASVTMKQSIVLSGFKRTAREPCPSAAAPLPRVGQTRKSTPSSNSATISLRAQSPSRSPTTRCKRAALPLQRSSSVLHCCPDSVGQMQDSDRYPTKLAPRSSETNLVGGRRGPLAQAKVASNAALSSTELQYVSLHAYT